MEGKLGQIQEKDAEIDRQQRELQTLRVRICDNNKLTSVVMVAAVVSVCRAKILPKMSSWLQCNLNFNSSR